MACSVIERFLIINMNGVLQDHAQSFVTIKQICISFCYLLTIPKKAIHRVNNKRTLTLVGYEH